ncbi:MAG: hypothetical protein IPL65_02000 [Lewinellaceae bacterium]|nr:hypothetical protein [Lewinellaceae bacterium]
MLPWFIYLLIQWGYLSTESQWFNLSPQQQHQYEIIINDVPVTDVSLPEQILQLNEADLFNPQNLPCSDLS